MQMKQVCLAKQERKLNMGNDQERSQKIIYLTTTAEKLHVFAKNDVPFLGDGTIYKSVRITLSTGVRKSLLIPLKNVDQVMVVKKGCNTSFECICSRTGGKLYFQGIVAETKSAPTIQHTEPKKNDAVQPVKQFDLHLDEVKTHEETEKTKLLNVEKKADRETALTLSLNHIAMQRQNGFDPLLDIKTFAVLSSRSEQTLYRLQKDGICPRPIKVGRSSRWKLSEVEAFIRTYQASRNTTNR